MVKLYMGVMSMKFFDGEHSYTDETKDDLLIFDGNIAIGTSSPKYGGVEVKTMINFRKAKRPENKEIGDLWEPEDIVNPRGLAFHFKKPESVQVVIDALNEIKQSMVENAHLAGN